jgi:protein-S-isoprenylcysteine O-methyltransferase Ste14
MRKNDQPSSSGGPEKDAAAVRFFPPGIPLLTVIVGFALNQVAPISSSLMPDGMLRYLIGSILIIAPVYFLGFRSVQELRRTGQSENPYKTTTEVVDSGPFRFTRNPMYLQMIVACLGFAVLLSCAWIAVLTPLCAVLLYFLVIRHEEAYLETKFGDAYLSYKERVRRWI